MFDNVFVRLKKNELLCIYIFMYVSVFSLHPKFEHLQFYPLHVLKFRVGHVFARMIVR